MKKPVLKWVMIGICVFLSSCAVEPETYSLFVLYRTSGSGCGPEIDVRIDGKRVGKATAGKEAEFQTTIGFHTYQLSNDEVRTMTLSDGHRSERTMYSCVGK